MDLSTRTHPPNVPCRDLRSARRIAPAFPAIAIHRSGPADVRDGPADCPAEVRKARWPGLPNRNDPQTRASSALARQGIDRMGSMFEILDPHATRESTHRCIARVWMPFQNPPDTPLRAPNRFPSQPSNASGACGIPGASERLRGPDSVRQDRPPTPPVRGRRRNLHPNSMPIGPPARALQQQRALLRRPRWNNP